MSPLNGGMQFQPWLWVNRVVPQIKAVSQSGPPKPLPQGHRVTGDRSLQWDPASAEVPYQTQLKSRTMAKEGCVESLNYNACLILLVPRGLPLQQAHNFKSFCD